MFRKVLWEACVNRNWQTLIDIINLDICTHDDRQHMLSVIMTGLNETDGLSESR